MLPAGAEKSRFLLIDSNGLIHSLFYSLLTDGCALLRLSAKGLGADGLGQFRLDG
jgi:hypothetical protein